MLRTCVLFSLCFLVLLVGVTSAFTQSWESVVGSKNGSRITLRYTFELNGMVKQESFLNGRLVGRRTGRYSYGRNNLVTVRWSKRSVERAKVQFYAGNKAMKYRIVSHTGNPRQAGRVLTFRKVLTPIQKQMLAINALRALQIQQQNTKAFHDFMYGPNGLYSPANIESKFGNPFDPARFKKK